ncbi:MAG: hypothetical protein HY670_01910 [Chloroflexi bacterium]|nr:hypothetical protein [Chloroflexota bacterium]
MPAKKAWTDDEIRAAIKEWGEKTRPEKLKTGDWRAEDLPLCDPPGVPRLDLWHRVHYLDELELTWGKKWGASGLGKLREVVVSRPTERDMNVSPIISGSPMHHIHAPRVGTTPTLRDLDEWQREHDTMVQILRDNGVTVHYIEYPKAYPEGPSGPIGPYGPIGVLTSIDCWVIWGGAIVGRFGIRPTGRGKERLLSEWLARMGCPILLTISGKGVCEPGAFMNIADDCMFLALGPAANMEGINQVIPVLERAGITTVHIVQHGGWVESCEWPMGGSYHMSLFMNPVDIGKMLLYPPLLSWPTIMWMRERGFELIEIPADEQRDFNPGCLICLEPGKVIMHAEAKESIRRVRRAGVEVIECPSITSRVKIGLGGGLNCRCRELVRDRGPVLADIK